MSTNSQLNAIFLVKTMISDNLPSVFIDEPFRVELVRLDKVLWVVHDEGDVGHEG